MMIMLRKKFPSLVSCSLVRSGTESQSCCVLHSRMGWRDTRTDVEVTLSSHLVTLRGFNEMKKVYF